MICYPYAIPNGICTEISPETHLKFHLGHPFLKCTPIQSRLPEGAFKKCGKQEKGCPSQAAFCD
jgi:hypothetical protein